jgi:hypothetical protein
MEKHRASEARLLWRRLCQAPNLICRRLTQRLYNEQGQNGETKRTRTFARPQSSSRAQVEIESQTQASAAIAC